MSFLPRDQTSDSDPDLKKRANILLDAVNNSKLVIDLNRNDFGRSYDVQVVGASIVSECKNIGICVFSVEIE